MNILEGTPGQAYELDILVRYITAWNEAIDEDLSEDSFNPTQINITPVNSIVIGTVAGGGERIDSLTITVPQGRELTITLVDYIAQGGNGTTGFNLHQGNQGLSGPDLSDNSFGEGNIGDVISPNDSPLPPGDYSLVIIKDTASLAYVLSFGLASSLLFKDGFED